MQNLYELTRLCIDNRPDRLKVMPWKPSNYILDRLRTLTRVNPDLTQWDSLYMNISMLVSAHARLFGREEPEELDIYAGVRCLRDSIRWRERAILDVILEKDGWVFKQKIRERTGMELIKKMVVNLAQKVMELENRLNKDVTSSEIERPIEAGVYKEGETYEIPPAPVSVDRKARDRKK